MSNAQRNLRSRFAVRASRFNFVNLIFFRRNDISYSTSGEIPAVLGFVPGTERNQHLKSGLIGMVS